MRLDEPSRLASLRQTGLLDSGPEAVFDRATRLASRLLQAPVALFSLVDEDRQFFKSQIGLKRDVAQARQTPLSHSFCQHVVTREHPLIIADARKEPLVRDNLAIRDLDVIAYLGVPIATSEGEVLGSFCVIESEPREWTADEVTLLEDIAAGVSSEVGLRLNLYRAHTVEAKLADAVHELERTAKQREALLADVNHRLKNSLQLVVSMLRLERQTPSAAGFKRLALRVDAIAAVHEQLYKSSTLRGVAFTAVLKDLTAQIALAHQASKRNVTVLCKAAEVELHTDLAISLSLLFTELLADALGPGTFEPAGGHLSIICDRSEDGVRLVFESDHVEDWMRELGANALAAQLLERVGGTFGATCNGTGSVHVFVPLNDRFDFA